MVNMLKVLTAVAILLLIIGIAMLGKRLKKALRFKSATTPQKESIWVELVAGLLVLFIATAFYINKRPDATIAMWIGTLVFFIGGLIQLIAKKQLRKNETYEELLNGGVSNATGLYKRVRHPSKTALVTLLAGYCLALGSYWALAIWLILFIPSVLFRISQEERILEEQHGSSWLSYKDDTKKLIPYLL